MLDQIFLAIYGITVAIFGLGYTIKVITGTWDKIVRESAMQSIERIYKQTGNRPSEKGMIFLTEFIAVVFALLPIINTYFIFGSIFSKLKKKLSHE